MTTKRRRRSYEEGHNRKYLLIVDESPEVDAALYFCASRIAHTSGKIILLYVIQPQGFQHWMGVRQVQMEEETNKARALFRLFRRKLNNAGFEHVVTEEVIREGKNNEEIIGLIEDDEDIAILVLGASTEQNGPGPLVTSLALGRTAGTFPIPMVIVPGDMTLEDLKSLA
ncbi:MAG: hypothetical protein RLZ98_3721 [Pseudomonadota bacterium]|jgi:nucleotide-binding universal stress UspA family protein